MAATCSCPSAARRRRLCAPQVVLAEDVNAIAQKLIALKTYYPTADMFKIVAQRPRLLLQKESQIVENAERVRGRPERLGAAGVAAPHD